MNVTLLRLKPVVKELNRLSTLFEAYLRASGVPIPGEAVSEPDDEVTYTDPERHGTLELKERLGILSDEERGELKAAIGELDDD